MLSHSDMKTIARDKIKDASALKAAGRYDGSVYLCGYAVEIALKARISRNFGWSGFPSSGRDFDRIKFLQTHDLEFLLRFTALEVKIKNHPHATHWARVSLWTPETRYTLTGAANEAQARGMIESARVLLKVLLGR